MDWGIGHASRCVPVIQQLSQAGFQVVIAASGRPLDFMKKEYPDIAVIDFPGTLITYPKNSDCHKNATVATQAFSGDMAGT